MDLFSFDEDLPTSSSFQGWHLSTDEPSTSSPDALSRPSPTAMLLRSPPPSAKKRGFSRARAAVFEDSTPCTSKSTSIACCPGSIRAGQLNHASANVAPPDGHHCQRPPAVGTHYKDIPNGGVFSPPSDHSAPKSIPQSLSEDVGSPTICANLAGMENVHLSELTFDIIVSDRYGGQATICELFPWNSVKDVKDALQRRGYPSASMQRLFVHGDKVKNIRTLHDCDISHGSDLYIMSIRNLTAQPNGFINFYGDATAAPAECLDLVRNVSHGTASGYAPALAFDGTGGTYFLKGRHKVKCAVFKPEDEEPFAPNNPRGYVGRLGQTGFRSGILSGEGAAREVAAFLLDRNHFSGVPVTTRAEMAHAGFHRARLGVGGVKVKIGSLQSFVDADATAGDYAPQIFDLEEVHKIGVLDIRLVNTDRNDANIMVIHEHGHTRLTPIDHGYCLPSILEIGWCDWVWLEWPQAKMPFSANTLDYIASIDVERDASLLRDQLSIREACLRIMVTCVMLLKQGAKAGLTLFQIASLIIREDLDQKSELESLIDQAEILAQNRLNEIGFASRSVSDPLDYLPIGPRSMSRAEDYFHARTLIPNSYCPSGVSLGAISNISPPRIQVPVSQSQLSSPNMSPLCSPIRTLSVSRPVPTFNGLRNNGGDGINGRRISSNKLNTPSPSASPDLPSFIPFSAPHAPAPGSLRESLTAPQPPAFGLGPPATIPTVAARRACPPVLCRSSSGVSLRDLQRSRAHSGLSGSGLSRPQQLRTKSGGYGTNRQRLSLFETRNLHSLELSAIQRQKGCPRSNFLFFYYVGSLIDRIIQRELRRSQAPSVVPSLQSVNGVSRRKHTDSFDGLDIEFTHDI
eukprot:182637_1